MILLVIERQARNVTTLYNSVVNILVEGRYVARKLQRNARDKHACIVDVSTTTREEEAGPKSLLLKLYVGNSTSDSRLPCTS